MVKKMRGERVRGRVYRDSHLHRGQSRRFSSSPDARFYGGVRGPSRVPLHGGDRGDWTVVRSRRRKALEQTDGQRDRFQEDQWRGRGWEVQQRRQSRARVQPGSELRYSDMEDLEEFEASVQSYDGRAVLQYSRPGRDRVAAQRPQPEHAGFRRRHASRDVQNQQRARPLPVQRRSRSARSREQVQQYDKHTGEGARVHSSAFHPTLLRRDQLVLDNLGKDKHPFVSFYFTNVPEYISHRSLRRGFEVCGIMEDVYLAWKRNVNRGFLVSFVLAM